MLTSTTTNPVANYREWGSGENPTVVILHGWGVDSAQYEKLGPLLAGKGYRVVVPDLPGWGKTSAPDTAWSVREYVTWVREFVQGIHNPPQPSLILREGAQSKPPLRVRGGRGSYDSQLIIFGHSFGGRIAIKYATKYPNELRALVLCAAAGIKPPLTLKRILFYCVAKVGGTLFQPPGLSFTGNILKRILYRLAGVSDYLHAHGIMKEVLAKAVKEDLKPLLPKIKTPTLLFWGTDDGATPYKDGQTMAHLIPGATLVTFEGERHNLPKHIPEKLVTEIAKYLNTHPSIPRN